jgi:hypothetical protein
VLLAACRRLDREELAERAGVALDEQAGADERGEAQRER